MSLFNCKVYLVRFALLQNQDQDNDSGGEHQRSWEPTCSSVPLSSLQQESLQAIYPSSVSIDELLKTGRLVKPKRRSNAVLDVEQFNMQSRQWEFGKDVTITIDNEKFSSGGFKDAFMGVETSSPIQEWVIKKYNNAALKTIEETLRTSIEAHTRKQVQMHSVANAITRKYSSKVPNEFGKCFSYNNIFYTKWNGEPATIEEFVEGTVHFQSTSTIMGNASIWLQTVKMLCCYVATDQKMLLDIQSSDYKPYDPEIATNELLHEENEIYFCCGNFSTSTVLWLV